MRSRGCLAFWITLAYTLYLVFKRLKHKSLLRCKAISTTEHGHGLYCLSHIGCTVTINRVKKSPKRCHSIGWKRTCEGIAQSCIFFLTVCVFVLLKLFLETARLMYVEKVWLCVRGPFWLKLHVVVS
jgi:hypothetical protein